MKKIFIDCGGHDGCSIVQLLSEKPEFECITFEPNQVFNKYYRFLPTTLINSAVSTYNGEVELTLDTIDGDGSSILPNKMVDFNGSVPNDQFPRKIVSCIDLSSYILKNYSPEDYIVLKLDIEGKEYDVLEKIILDGVISMINELFCEFHWKKMGLEKKEHERLIEKITKYISIADWDAYAFAIHYKGRMKRCKRVYLVCRIWLHRLIYNFRINARR
jgi:FkbM family methyltransferase